MENEKKPKYIEGIGRRKESTARVRIYPKIKERLFSINQKDYQQYFPQIVLQKVIFGPLEKLNLGFPFQITVKVKGGGFRGQAEAISLGLARALSKYNPDFKKILKSSGFLTVDSRKVERKKFGKKKARRAPQWQKR